MIDDISFLLPIVRTAVGEANVVSAMRSSDSDERLKSAYLSSDEKTRKEQFFGEKEIGGEGNGGVILKEVHLGRDSLVAITLVLNLIASRKKTISDMVSLLPNYVFLKDKIILNDSTKNFDLDKLATRFDCDEINRDDGIKFSWPKKWIHIRKSNTEPIIRIFDEAKKESEVNSLIQT